MASYYYYMEFYPSNCTYEYSRLSHKKSRDPQEMLRLIFVSFCVPEIDTDYIPEKYKEGYYKFKMLYAEFNKWK